MSTKKEPVDKTSPEYFAGQVHRARSSIGLILIFTVVNLVMLLVNVNSYFLFSVSVPYYLTLLAYTIEDYAIGTVTTVCLVISAVILGVYLLCFLLSKKKVGKSSFWLITALVLFIIDTLALLLVTFGLLESPASNILDLVFHGWVIWELAASIRSNAKLRQLNQQSAASLTRPQVELD